MAAIAWFGEATTTIDNLISTSRLSNRKQQVANISSAPTPKSNTEHARPAAIALHHLKGSIA